MKKDWWPFGVAIYVFVPTVLIPIAYLPDVRVAQVAVLSVPVVSAVCFVLWTVRHVTPSEQTRRLCGPEIRIGMQFLTACGLLLLLGQCVLPALVEFRNAAIAAVAFGLSSLWLLRKLRTRFGGDRAGTSGACNTERD